MASFFRSNTAIKPHPYQRSAAAAVFRTLRLQARQPPSDPSEYHRRGQLVVMPTGTGKTILFGFLAGALAQRGRRVLILAHRDRLIGQAADKLDKVGVKVAVEKAERKGLLRWSLGSVNVVVGSVQTMQGNRLASWPRDAFDLIIVDEGHRSTAKSYTKIFDHFANASILGVTATDRSKKGQLKRIYGTKAYEFKLIDAINQGYLVPVFGVRSDVQIDLRGLKTCKNGDFDPRELDERICQVIEPLALGIRKEIGDRCTIAFTPDVRSAQGLADALSRLGVLAASTHGNDPNQTRTLAQFERGEIQVLCNCDLLTEGYDHPPISAVVIARPTKSSTRMMQGVGRGTRLHPQSGKKDCMVVDFGWMVDQDTIQTLVDLFADEENPATVQAAKKMLADGTETDPRTALEKAEEIRQAREAKEAQRQRDKLRVPVRDRPVDYRKVVFDPFRVREVLGQRPVSAPPTGVVGMPVAPDTAAALQKEGYQTTAGMSQREALEQLRIVTQRRECGMSSLPQITRLIRMGVPPQEAANMTSKEAGQRIGRNIQHYQSRKSSKRA